MTAFNYLFFDLDGTLVDSSKGITESFNHTFEQLGKERPSNAVIDSFIGPPLEVSLASVVSRDQLDKAVSLYRSYYKEKGIYGAELYKGVKELLIQLNSAGFKLYVTTSKHEPVSLTMLDNLGILDKFEAVFGSQPGAIHKADVLRRAIKTCQVPLQEAIIIGDTKFDMIGGEEVGIARLGVLWGMGSKQELEAYQADYLADEPWQILNIVSGKP